MVSWTVGGHFSLALQLKPVGAERPDWHAAEPLIMPFSLFYGAADIFRATNLNALLKTTRWMAVRADQILKKTDATLDHGLPTSQVCRRGSITNKKTTRPDRPITPSTIQISFKISLMVHEIALLLATRHPS